ncbi:MAG: DUF308 domain-containing protein [Ruminococcus sp.]|nr:DUF308 domain-containing protein [Ruminococcus sp.]
MSKTEEIKISKWKLLLPAILVILFEAAVGVMLLINPLGFTRWVIFALGALLVILSIVFLVIFIRARKAGEKALGPEIGAIICFIIGAFFMIFSQTEAVIGLINSFYIFFGIVIFIVGLNKIISFIVRRHNDTMISWFNIFSGIIALGLGVLIVFFPRESAGIAWTIMGISLLLEAVFDIVSVIHTAVLLNRVSATDEVELKVLVNEFAADDDPDEVVIEDAVEVADEKPDEEASEETVQEKSE